jgi:hypothetical protein
MLTTASRVRISASPTDHRENKRLVAGPRAYVRDTPRYMAISASANLFRTAQVCNVEIFTCSLAACSGTQCHALASPHLSLPEIQWRWTTDRLRHMYVPAAHFISDVTSIQRSTPASRGVMRDKDATGSGLFRSRKTRNMCNPVGKILERKSV